MIPLKVQYIIAVSLIFAGIVLLFCGIWIPPVGVIHTSILIAFGEILTFVGALIGVDYKYKFNKDK